LLALKDSPKGLLAMVDIPRIKYAFEKAVAAGITDIMFRAGNHKRAIEDHFAATRPP
jgi:UTP-glucose-1-phosphate uridylyltransferase